MTNIIPNKLYFYNIDFLRFLFSIFIVLFHFATIGFLSLKSIPVFASLSQDFRASSICVEFFFVISGFFFYLFLDVNKSLGEFIKQKVIRLWPVLFFTVCMFFIAYVFKLVQFYKYDNILALLFLNGIGFNYGHPYNGLGNVHPSWYISALFWSLLLYFYLFKYCDIKKVFFVIIIFIYLGLRIQNLKIAGVNVELVNIIFYSGVRRSLSCIGIGIFIAYFYKKAYQDIIKWTPTKISKIVLTSLECGTLYWILSLLWNNNISTKNIVVILLMFLLLLGLFICKKGYLSCLLNNKLSKNLGKYSYSIYVTHAFVLEICRNHLYVTDNVWVISNPLPSLFIPTLISILLGIVTYELIEKNFILWGKEEKANV